MKSFFAIGILLQVFCGTAFGQRSVPCATNGNATTINILRSRADTFGITGCNFLSNSFSCDSQNKCSALSSYTQNVCVAYENNGSQNIGRFSNFVTNQNIGFVTSSCYDNLSTGKKMCEMFVRTVQGQFLSKQGCEKIINQLNKPTAGTNSGTIPGTPGTPGTPGNIPQTYPPVQGPQEVNCVSYGNKQNIQRFMNVVNSMNSTIESTSVNSQDRAARKITSTTKPSTRPGFTQVFIKSANAQSDCNSILQVMPTLRSNPTFAQDCTDGCFDTENSYCVSECQQYWLNGQNYRCYAGSLGLSDLLKTNLDAVSFCKTWKKTVIDY